MRPQYRENGSRMNSEFLLLYRDDLKWPDGSTPDDVRSRTQVTTDHRVGDVRSQGMLDEITGVGDPVRQHKEPSRKNQGREPEESTTTGDDVEPESLSYGILEAFVDNLGDLGVCKPQYQSHNLSKQTWQDAFSDLVDIHGDEKVIDAVDKVTGKDGAIASPAKWRTKQDWKDLLSLKNAGEMFARYFDDALSLTKKDDWMKPDGRPGVLHVPAGWNKTKTIKETNHVTD